MDFFRRIGTVRHKFKVQFFIKKVTFNQALNGRVYISIRRGDHKVNSQQEMPFERKTCHFKNELLCFPALTLFYDQSEHLYQEKQGEIKVILKTDKDQKKLLGVVPFDVATYANQPDLNPFKQKKELEQTPQNLTGHLSFQVSVECLGEGSETSKSVAKEEKTGVREESPFNKVSTFFSGLVGGKEEAQSLSKSNHSAEKKAASSKNKEEKAKRRDKPEQNQQEEEEDELFNRSKVKAKRGSKPRRAEEEESKSSKIKSNNSKEAQSNIREQEGEDQLFNRPKASVPPTSKTKKEKTKKKKEQPVEGSDGVEDSDQGILNKNQVQTLSSKYHQQSDLSRPGGFKAQLSSNAISQSDQGPLTEVGHEGRAKRKPSPFKSQPNMPNEKAQFYFDDPVTFPENTKMKKKKQQEPIEKSAEVEGVPDHKQKPTSKNQKFFDTPKASKKVKQNSISISSKGGGQISREEANKKEVGVFKMEVSSQAQPKKEQQRKGSVEKIKEEIKEKEAIELAKMETLLNQTLAREKTLEQEHRLLTQKYQLLLTSMERIKSEVEEKSKIIKQFASIKAALGEQLQKKSKQMNDKKQEQEQTCIQLKAQISKLQKAMAALKAQNQSLKAQLNKNQSFFRETQEHYEGTSKPNELEEEVKRLEKEKNECLLALQKQKEKNKKDAKKYAQDLEKETLRFKEYEDLSKAELKKVKDEAMNKQSGIDNLKEKLKEKVKEEEILLKDNKAMNTTIIDLKQKLASLKIKICEKLNQANEKGCFQIMEALTDLNQEL